MICSESTANIFKAFAAFQAAVTGPAKNGKGNYGEYVLLDDLVLLRKTLAEHGLSFTQSTASNAEGMGVETTIMHESGEWFSSDLLLLPMERRTPQGAGSAITYGRRYSLGAALGVASESDDDAQHAEDLQSGKSNTRSPSPATDAPASPQDAPGGAKAAPTTNAPKPASKAQIAGIRGFIKELGYDADDARVVIHEQTGREDAFLGTTKEPGNITHAEAEKIVAHLTAVHAERAAKADADAEVVAAQMGGTLV